MGATRVTLATNGRYDLAATLSLLTMGRRDPSFRIDDPSHVRLALSGPDGPVAVSIDARDEEIHVDLSGSSTDWLIPLLPAFLGVDFQPPSVSAPRKLRSIARRLSGMRLPKLPTVFDRLVAVVLQQLVSFRDACDGWNNLLRHHGRPLGDQADLLAPPTPATLARLPVHGYVACGILPQHARRIIGLARYASRIESTWGGGVGSNSAQRTCDLLAKLPGLGPWSISFLRGTCLGDSDALVVGDYSIPKQVNHFLTGDDNGNDEVMRELLEPYRPHRFYVLSLIIKSGVRPPRKGPRPRLLRDRL